MLSHRQPVVDVYTRGELTVRGAPRHPGGAAAGAGLRSATARRLFRKTRVATFRAVATGVFVVEHGLAGIGRHQLGKSRVVVRPAVDFIIRECDGEALHLGRRAALVLRGWSVQNTPATLHRHCLGNRPGDGQQQLKVLGVRHNYIAQRTHQVRKALRKVGGRQSFRHGGGGRSCGGVDALMKSPQDRRCRE